MMGENIKKRKAKGNVENGGKEWKSGRDNWEEDDGESKGYLNEKVDRDGEETKIS